VHDQQEAMVGTCGASLQLGELGSGLFEQWQVGIVVSPPRKKLLVSGARFCGLVLQRVGAGET